MTILGHAVKPWVVWAGGGVAVLLVLLYLRSRGQGAAQEAPAGDGGGSFGAGATAGSAPAQMGGSAGGTDFASQLDQLQLQEGQQRLTQSRQMFDLQLQDAQQQIGLQNQMGQAYVGYQSGLYGNAVDVLKGTQQSEIALQNQINLTNAAHEKELGKASADYCPAGTSMRLDPNTGQYICRGKSGGLPVISDISRAIDGFLRGVTQAAPGIGYGAANTAAQYYEGRLFGPGGGQAMPQATSGGRDNTRFNFTTFTPGIAGGYPGSPVPAGGGRIYGPEASSGGEVLTGNRYGPRPTYKRQYSGLPSSGIG